MPNVSGPLDPSILQQLNRVADNNNDGQLSFGELQDVAGEDMTLDEAEGESLGLNNESRNQVNTALQSVRNVSMNPNEVVFGRSAAAAEPPPEIPDDPNVRTVGRETRNFMEYLRPLNSSGDNVQLQLSGHAEVGVGWLGFEASGSASVNITREGDAYLVTLGVAGQGGVSAGRGVSVGVNAGASSGMTYRFESAQEANNFLKYQMRENIPQVDRFLPNLDDLSRSEERAASRVRPFNTDVATHVGARIGGKIELGSFKVEGGASFTRQNVDRTFAGGRTSNDTYNTAEIHASIQRGDFRASVSGSYTTANIEYHPDPNKMGDFNVLNGSISLTFSPRDRQDISDGNTDAVTDRLTEIGNNMNLTGPALSRFIGSSLQQIHSAVNSDTGGSVTIGLTAQAKWRDGGDSGEDELVFFRLGTQATASYTAGFDVGVAEVSLSASASMTDYTDIM